MANLPSLAQEMERSTVPVKSENVGYAGEGGSAYNGALTPSTSDYYYVARKTCTMGTSSTTMINDCTVSCLFSNKSC